MNDYQKLIAVGGAILALPAVRPFLAFASRRRFLFSSVGVAVVLLGLIVMRTERS